jgi:catechol 2,3-dioxygenase-like lactoylglutathione lyase family enzyme
MIHAAHFILYVADPLVSRTFYTAVLGTEPVLDVPGMTEFRSARHCVDGLSAPLFRPPARGCEQKGRGRSRTASRRQWGVESVAAPRSRD